MQPVKMYTTQVCPYCQRAKMLLKQRGVEAIEEVRIDLDPDSARPDDEPDGPPHRAANLHWRDPCGRL
jgi:hypothetical protein